MLKWDGVKWIVDEELLVRESSPIKRGGIKSKGGAPRFVTRFSGVAPKFVTRVRGVAPMFVTREMKIKLTKLSKTAKNTT